MARPPARNSAPTCSRQAPYHHAAQAEWPAVSARWQRPTAPTTRRKSVSSRGTSWRRSFRARLGRGGLVASLELGDPAADRLVLAGERLVGLELGLRGERIIEEEV